MTDIFWPELLPAGFLAEGFSKQPQSNVIRTQMDAGARKARRRYTARTINYTGKQRFDTAELAVFEQFYHNVLADGVLRFIFEDPLSSEPGEFRFTADYSVSEFDGYYEVTIPLEKL
jgi:hypothetical protein